ncbi:MAG TPA: FkbM family methyltransferase, partial [Acidimicrobiales bacterium]|nr:FkbM family methyltransferase [Acidimicrobiales bacterium]
RVRNRLRPGVRAVRRVRRGDVSLEQIAFGRAVSMSQFGEDLILAQLFADRDDGFYVDVGALHPGLLSNTHNLYRRGWHGINLEPVPEHRAVFEQFRRRDLNLGYAIGAEHGTARFMVDAGFSSFEEHFHTDTGGRPTRMIEVPVRTLAEVLDEHLAPAQQIDLLDVDCEGADAIVLRSNDWDRYRPRVVLAERLPRSADPEHDPFPILEAQGYRLHCQLHLTGVFLSPDWPDPPT